MLLTSLSPSSGSFLFPFGSRATSFCPFNSLFPLIFSTFLHFLPSHAIPFMLISPLPANLPAGPATATRWISASPAPSSNREVVSFPPPSKRARLCRNVHGVTDFMHETSSWFSVVSDPELHYVQLVLFGFRSDVVFQYEISWPHWMSPMNLLSCLLTRSLFIFNNYSPADLGSISPIRLMYVDVINWTGFKTEIISIKGGYKAEFWSLFTGCVVSVHDWSDLSWGLSSYHQI